MNFYKMVVSFIELIKATGKSILHLNSPFNISNFSSVPASNILLLRECNTLVISAMASRQWQLCWPKSRPNYNEEKLHCLVAEIDRKNVVRER